MNRGQGQNLILLCSNSNAPLPFVPTEFSSSQNLFFNKSNDFNFLDCAVVHSGQKTCFQCHFLHLLKFPKVQLLKIWTPDFFFFFFFLKGNIFGFCHHLLSTKKLLSVYLEIFVVFLILSGFFLFV